MDYRLKKWQKRIPTAIERPSPRPYLEILSVNIKWLVSYLLLPKEIEKESLELAKSFNKDDIINKISSAESYCTAIVLFICIKNDFPIKKEKIYEASGLPLKDILSSLELIKILYSTVK